MKKIVHVTEALGGGVLRVLELCIADQLRRGNSVFLVYSRRPDTPSEEELDSIFPATLVRFQIKMRKDPGLHDINGCIEIWKILRRVDADVVHAHSSKAGALTRAVFPFFRGRVFYTPHGFSFARQDVSRTKRFVFWAFEAIGSFLGGTIIACSISEARMARRLPRWSQVRLAQNGVVDVACKLYSGRLETKLVVVSVGRLSSQKAPERFFELASTFPQVNFVWVGDGELRPAASEYLPNLEITGWKDRSEINAYLVSADVFCMLSKWEGMPLALLEAKTVGLPALVLDIDGCREAVNDAVTGYVCANMDEVKLRLRELIETRFHVVEMGKAARAHALEFYSSERMCNEIFEIYSL